MTINLSQIAESSCHIPTIPPAGHVLANPLLRLKIYLYLFFYKTLLFLFDLLFVFYYMV